MTSFQGKFDYFFKSRLTNFITIGEHGAGEYFLQNPYEEVGSLDVKTFIQIILNGDFSIDPIFSNYGLKWNIDTLENFEKGQIITSYLEDCDLIFDIESEPVEIIQICGRDVNFVREGGEVVTITLSDSLRLFKI